MTNNNNSTLVPQKNLNKSVAKSRSATRQLERAKRQAILMRTVEEQSTKGKTPTFAELSEIMRKDHWINSRWPEYTAEMARYDFGEVMALTRDDIKGLAMPYLARQLGIIDKTTDTLQKMVDNSQLDDDTRIKAANSLRGYVGEVAKIFSLYAPKETHVKKQELVGTIDDFLKLRNEAASELKELENDAIIDADEDDIEEGEYEDA